MPWAGFEPTIPATNRPRPTPPTARPLWPALKGMLVLKRFVATFNSFHVAFRGFRERCPVQPLISIIQNNKQNFLVRWLHTAGRPERSPYWLCLRQITEVSLWYLPLNKDDNRTSHRATDECGVLAEAGCVPFWRCYDIIPDRCRILWARFDVTEFFSLDPNSFYVVSYLIIMTVLVITTNQSFIDLSFL
jgi:hypothetical protein